MLGNTAQNILSMLKGEIGNDMSSAISPGGDSVFYQQIYNMQNWLQAEYDWPFLRIYYDVPLNYNQRYYPMPVDSEGNQIFNLDRPLQAWCYWSSLWNDTDIGINFYDYNVVNPDLNMTLVPVRKWQLFQPPMRTYAPLTAPTTATGSSGVLSGNYYYTVTYVTAYGETEFSPVSTVVSPSSQQVSLTAIPVSSDTAVTARKIYRTTGSSTASYYFLTKINDNKTTTYTDNTADSSLPLLPASSDNTTQQPNFEVWPVPADGTMRFRFLGQRTLSPFAQPTDRADLDDMLIMLYCAAQFQSANNPARAQVASAKAQTRLNNIIEGYPSNNEAFYLSSGSSGAWPRRDWSKYVTVATMVGGTNASTG